MSETLQPVANGRKPGPAPSSRDELSPEEARRALRAAETALRQRAKLEEDA